MFGYFTKRDCWFNRIVIKVNHLYWALKVAAFKEIKKMIVAILNTSNEIKGKNIWKKQMSLFIGFELINESKRVIVTSFRDRFFDFLGFWTRFKLFNSFGAINILTDKQVCSFNLLVHQGKKFVS